MSENVPKDLRVVFRCACYLTISFWTKCKPLIPPGLIDHLQSTSSPAPSSVIDCINPWAGTQGDQNNSIYTSFTDDSHFFHWKPQGNKHRHPTCPTKAYDFNLLTCAFFRQLCQSKRCFCAPRSLLTLEPPFKNILLGAGERNFPCPVRSHQSNPPASRTTSA